MRDFYDQLAQQHRIVMTLHIVFAANNSDPKQTVSGFHWTWLKQCDKKIRKIKIAECDIQ